MSNYSDNKAAIDKFRKELMAELGEISDIDKNVIERVVNQEMYGIREGTPKDTGKMRAAWQTFPAVKGPEGVVKVIVNIMDYSSFVNDGHRIVNKDKETVGFVPGYHMLENGVKNINKRVLALFKAEVERIDKKYDK